MFKEFWVHYSRPSIVLHRWAAKSNLYPEGFTDNSSVISILPFEPPQKSYKHQARYIQSLYIGILSYRRPARG